MLMSGVKGRREKSLGLIAGPGPRRAAEGAGPAVAQAAVALDGPPALQQR